MNIYLTGSVAMMVATVIVVVQGLARASRLSLEAIDADYARGLEAARTQQERDAILMAQTIFNASHRTKR